MKENLVKRRLNAIRKNRNKEAEQRRKAKRNWQKAEDVCDFPKHDYSKNIMFIAETQCSDIYDMIDLM